MTPTVMHPLMNPKTGISLAQPVLLRIFIRRIATSNLTLIYFQKQDLLARDQFFS